VDILVRPGAWRDLHHVHVKKGAAAIDGGIAGYPHVLGRLKLRREVKADGRDATAHVAKAVVRNHDVPDHRQAGVDVRFEIDGAGHVPSRTARKNAPLDGDAVDVQHGDAVPIVGVAPVKPAVSNPDVAIVSLPALQPRSNVEAVSAKAHKSHPFEKNVLHPIDRGEVGELFEASRLDTAVKRQVPEHQSLDRAAGGGGLRVNYSAPAKAGRLGLDEHGPP
jgi:hypothetical protein